MFEPFQYSMQSLRSFLAMAGLACLPGCSGCESRTSSEIPPLTRQTESSPAEAKKSTDRQGAAASKSSQDGPPSEVRPTRGKPDFSQSDAVASSDGGLSSLSQAESASKSTTGGETALKNSESGSADGESVGSGGDRGPGKAKSSNQTTGKPSSPNEAVSIAKALMERSNKAATDKEYGRAFELATKAWESVQAFPKDATCHAMSSDLLRRIDELGTLANSQREENLKRNKPLIVR